MFDNLTSKDISVELEKNRNAFSNYNTVRMREMIRYLTDRKLEIFLKIPFYLQINTSRYPGYVHTDSAINGIHNFLNSGCCKLAVKEKLFPKSIAEYIQVENPVILGLYHIGSLGTFTQSSGSDFDFWVVIDKTKFNLKSYAQFQKKLNDIVKYCREDYDQEVTFFVMDHKKLKKDIYQSFDEIDTLAVPKIFLKEEFYRTYLMIAGKIPLWSVLPSGLDEVDRTRYTAQFLNISRDLIDLGHIESIPFRDTIKGLLWHICKSVEDPVKALIKATTIFSYQFGSAAHKTLLCQSIKENYADSGIDDFRADPYKLVFDRILDFHQAIEPKGLNLIKNAVFFRLCGYPNVKLPVEQSPKRELLNQYIFQWHLSTNQLNKLLSYTQWSESEKKLHEKAIVHRLAEMFNQTLKRAGDLNRLFVSDNEKKQWEILKNKTRTRLKHHEKKIQPCSTYLKKMHIDRIIMTQKGNKWHILLIESSKKDCRFEFTYSSFSQGLGWILENNLYKRHQCSFESRNHYDLYENETRTLAMDDIYLAAAPIKPLDDKNYAKKEFWRCQLVFLFFEPQGDGQILSGCDLIGINSWGDVYADTVNFDIKMTKTKKLDLIAEQVRHYKNQKTRIKIFQFTALFQLEIGVQLQRKILESCLHEASNENINNRPYLDTL